MSGIDEFFGDVLAVVREIPPGRVASYGQVATLAGRPGAARWVGRALGALPSDSGVPWHRVLNASGRITNHSGTFAETWPSRLRAHAFPPASPRCIAGEGRMQRLIAASRRNRVGRTSPGSARPEALGRDSRVCRALTFRIFACREDPPLQ